MKIGLLFLTFILGHPFAFANGEPPTGWPAEGGTRGHKIRKIIVINIYWHQEY